MKKKFDNMLNPYTFASLSTKKENLGPFVYRLGLKIFILARRVRLPYGLRKGWQICQPFLI